MGLARRWAADQLLTKALAADAHRAAVDAGLDAASWNMACSLDTNERAGAEGACHGMTARCFERSREYETGSGICPGERNDLRQGELAFRERSSLVEHYAGDAFQCGMRARAGDESAAGEELCVGARQHDRRGKTERART